MTSTRTVWLLVLGVVCVSSSAVVQDTAWEKYNGAGMAAYAHGRHAEAEKHWKAALKEAEKFGERDPRLATSLNNLGLLQSGQGRYTEAEPLFRRALAIREKALGPEHREVAQSLNNLAALYQAQGNHAEGEPLLQAVGSDPGEGPGAGAS